MSADPLEISEVNDDTWTFCYQCGLKVDRTAETIADLLESQNVTWSINNYRADVLLFKERIAQYTPGHIINKLIEISKKSGRSYLNLIGEPVEYTPLGWTFNAKQMTLSVAPGNKFKRFYFSSVWADPEIESWQDRLGDVVYIGRPTPERIKRVAFFIQQGIDLDIYSQQAWPFAQWKGFIEGGIPGEHALLKKYKFRLVIENSYTHLYHSEKLFNTLRAGVVPFYLCDPALDVPFIKDLYIQPTRENLAIRKDIAPALLANINDFMFSKKWEMYSIKNQYLQILEFARSIADVRAATAP